MKFTLKVAEIKAMAAAIWYVYEHSYQLESWRSHPVTGVGMLDGGLLHQLIDLNEGKNDVTGTSLPCAYRKFDDRFVLQLDGSFTADRAVVTLYLVIERAIRTGVVPSDDPSWRHLILSFNRLAERLGIAVIDRIATLDG